MSFFLQDRCQVSQHCRPEKNCADRVLNCSFFIYRDLFKVTIGVFISSEEREPVPQDGVDHVWTAGIVAEAFAEVAVDKVADDGVHGLRGEQLVDGGLESSVKCQLSEILNYFIKNCGNRT